MVRSLADRTSQLRSRPPAEGLRGFAAERSSAGVMASKKDESNLMLRLMMKEREQVTPDDKLFFQELSEYIDRMQVEVTWVANKRFEISKFKFKFPRARTYKFIRARSRLYRSQMLQANTRWKALAEMYTMHSFAPFSNLKIFIKTC